MPNPNRWNLKILAALIGVASLAAALPVEARPVFRSPYYREASPLGPIPYRGPVITHIPIGSATGSPTRLRSSSRYYSRPNSIRYYGDSYPVRRETIRNSTLVNPTTRYYEESYPVRRDTIRDSTLVNPTIINSEIDDSVLINPTIVNPRSRHRDYERRYYRRQYSVPSSGIYIQFGN